MRDRRTKVLFDRWHPPSSGADIHGRVPEAVVSPTVPLHTGNRVVAGVQKNSPRTHVDATAGRSLVRGSREHRFRHQSINAFDDALPFNVARHTCNVALHLRGEPFKS